jgi:hypothetical protein
MSELLDKRFKFTWCVYHLLGQMIDDKMKPCLGKDGLKHMTGSLHYDGLAVDIDLFDENGHYMNRTEDHKKYGDFWERLDKDAFWGGNGIKNDGLKNDGNHYSITYQNKK